MSYNKPFLLGQRDDIIHLTTYNKTNSCNDFCFCDKRKLVSIGLGAKYVNEVTCLKCHTKFLKIVKNVLQGKLPNSFIAAICDINLYYEIKDTIILIQKNNKFKHELNELLK